MMIDIINSLNENKEWLFSGIGVAVGGIIYGLLKKNNAEPNRTLIMGNNNSGILSGRDIVIKELNIDNRSTGNESETGSKESFELFYHPIQDAIRTAEKFKKDPYDLELWDKIQKYKTNWDSMDTTILEYADRYVTKELEKVAKYRFYAADDTHELFEKYLYGEESEKDYTELSRLINRDIENYKNSFRK